MQVVWKWRNNPAREATLWKILGDIKELVSKRRGADEAKSLSLLRMKEFLHSVYVMFVILIELTLRFLERC